MVSRLHLWRHRVNKTLLQVVDINFGVGYDRFETLTIFQIQVHRVSKNSFGVGFLSLTGFEL